MDDDRGVERLGPTQDSCHLKYRAISSQYVWAGSGKKPRKQVSYTRLSVSLSRSEQFFDHAHPWCALSRLFNIFLGALGV